MSSRHARQAGAQAFKVVVPHLPSFSNHTDFDPLQLHPAVDVHFARQPDQVDGADLIVLPGSKSVRGDLIRLKQKGWDDFLQRHLRYGGKVLGICGGFQMLGRAIHDPYGVEGESGSVEGLGVLDMETTLHTAKCLRQVTGTFAEKAVAVQGYEIHMGISQGAALSRPLFKLADRDDGAISADDQVAGSYVHGLFDVPEACDALLEWAGHRQRQAVDFQALREAGIERIADAWADHCDFAKLDAALSAFYAG